MDRPAHDDPAERARRIDEICLAFEDAWLTGQAPDLRQYVATSGVGAQSDLLGELLRLELHYRAKAGHAINPAAYAAQFPEHAEVVRSVFRARKR